MTDVAEAGMSRKDAKALTGRIRDALGVTWGLVLEAFEGRAWVALGYESWAAYTREEFGSDRMRLPRVERREAVQSLRDAGMSTRAIASGLGVDAKTVRNDLGGGENSPPAPAVTGTDGKSYPPSRYAEARRLLRAAAKAHAAAVEAAEAARVVREWMPDLTPAQRREVIASDVPGLDGDGATVLGLGVQSGYYEGRLVSVERHGSKSWTVRMPDGTTATVSPDALVGR